MSVTNLSSIQPTHRDAAWQLQEGEAMRLPIGPGQRELRVLEGRIWVTQRGQLSLPSDDYWLEAGDALNLPSGAELVIEAWPTARFQLLVPPQACPNRLPRRAVSRPSVLATLLPRLTTA
jgi:Protein of unknown function (DUF2917)